MINPIDPFSRHSPHRIEVLQASLVGVEHADDELMVMQEFRGAMGVLLTKHDQLYTDVTMLARIGNVALSDDELRFSKARAAICLFEQALYGGVVGVDNRGNEAVAQYHDMQAKLGEVPDERHLEMWHGHYKHVLRDPASKGDEERSKNARAKGRRAVEMATGFGLPRSRAVAARFMLQIHL